MNRDILKLNLAGQPIAWLDFDHAATAIATGQVTWSLGETTVPFRGGIQSNGVQSRLDIPPIIAVRGRVVEKLVPVITNPVLFARDRHMCLYCGQTFMACALSKDHVYPESRGGADTYENCVTACKRCNGHKADRTPEEAGMELLAIPFAPNIFEWFFLDNKNVLADQMEYLQTRFQNLEPLAA